MRKRGKAPFVSSRRVLEVKSKQPESCLLEALAMAMLTQARPSAPRGLSFRSSSAEQRVPAQPGLARRGRGAEAQGLTVRAVRVAGVEVPNNKKAYVALTRIYGIGETRAWQTLGDTGIENKRMRDMTEEEITKVREYIDNNFTVEGDLRREKNQAIKRLIEIQCYRGTRHQKGLPARGQRTDSNARTRKGPKKTVSRKKK